MLTQEEFQVAYEAILCPDDPGRFNNYLCSVWIKYQIAHYLQPERIVELGVRAGYSAWAMKEGAPGATMIGFDNFAPGNQGKYGKEKELESHADWLLGKLGITLVKENTQEIDMVPPAELYHVDAHHSYEDQYSDIMLCMKANPDSVIVVHDANAPEVRSAIKDAMLACWPNYVCQHVDSEWGDAIISKTLHAWVDDIVPFRDDLVKEDA